MSTTSLTPYLILSELYINLPPPVAFISPTHCSILTSSKLRERGLLVTWMWAVTVGNELVTRAHCQLNVHNAFTSRTRDAHWQNISWVSLGDWVTFGTSTELGIVVHQCTSVSPSYWRLQYDVNSCDIVQLWLGVITFQWAHLKSRLQQRLARGYVQTFGASCQPANLRLFWLFLSLQSRIKLIAVWLGGA